MRRGCYSTPHFLFWYAAYYGTSISFFFTIYCLLLKKVYFCKMIAAKCRLIYNLYEVL